MINQLQFKRKRILEYIPLNKLAFFYIFSIIYCEMVYVVAVYKSISFGFILPMLFAIPAGLVFYLLTSILSSKLNRRIGIFFTLYLGLLFNLYYIYNEIFKTVFSVYSFLGAKDVLEFKDVIIKTILQNIVVVSLFFFPLFLLIIYQKRINFSQYQKRSLLFISLLILISFTVSILSVKFTANQPNSPYTLYSSRSSPLLAVKKLGLMTTIRLDIENLLFGIPKQGSINTFNHQEGKKYEQMSLLYNTVTSMSRKSPKAEPLTKYNILDINFSELLKSEKNETIRDMHQYFWATKPSAKNEYTGLFKDHNLILITAESLYPYAISPEYTPTLYQMMTEGFVFSNFYNSLWGVSTSDGEYVACTGLIPKTGVWSFATSGKNYMPFALGNQFKQLGYLTKAYHNHFYRFYDRHISHPNMGYEYRGVGNGLVVKNTWPESDLEMIEVTTDDYISNAPFHTYYMSVSGHFEYNFTGHEIAIKNKKYVVDSSYSDPSKAYIAANMELEFALKELIKQLEEQGIAENTVIAISPDHYPYGLAKEHIDELVGHEVENNFELYKGVFILWKKGMEPIIINKPCSSLDIIPTISNLFGLEFDSRLMIGRDIFANERSIVIFGNHNWITEKGYYLYDSDTFINNTSEEITQSYIDNINKHVEKQFNYSTRILEEDYYRIIMSQP